MNQSQGIKAGAPPWEYTVMQYRKYMGISWQQFLDTPPEVVYTDLAMIDIESDIEAAQIKKKPKT